MNFAQTRKDTAEAQLTVRLSELVACHARKAVFLEAIQSVPAASGVAKKLEDKLEQETKSEIDIQKSIVEIKAVISALNEIAKILPKSDKPFALRQTSELFKVESFIRTQGGPVNLDEIMRGIGAQGEDKKKSLRGSLRSYAREGKIFTNGPMTDSFSLLEFQPQPSVLTNSGGAQGSP